MVKKVLFRGVLQWESYNRGWYQKGHPFQDPRVGSCLKLENELSKETHVLTKQETLLGRDAWAESSSVRERRKTALPRGSSLRSYGDAVSFPSCLWPMILPVPIFGLIQGPSWWCLDLSVKIFSSVRVSGRLAGHIMGCLFLSFGPSWILPVSFWWQWHVSYGDFLLWDNSCK